MILVTGARGNIGREVVAGLVSNGQAVRAAAFDAADAKRVPAGVETVHFDFADAKTYGPAVDAVERLFLMRPP